MFIKLFLGFLLLLLMPNILAQPYPGWKQELDSLVKVDPFIYELKLKAIIKRCFEDRTKKYRLEIAEQEKIVHQNSKGSNTTIMVEELITLADFHEQAGQYNLATTVLLDAYNLAEAKGDSVSMGKVKIEIDDLNYVKHGAVVHKEGTYEGVEYLKLSVDPQTIVYYHLMKAKLSVDRDSFSYHLTTAYKMQKAIVQEDSSDTKAWLMLSNLLNGMAILVPDPEKALLESIEIGYRSKSYYQLLFSLNNLGYIYHEKGKYQKALKTFFEAMQICLKERYPDLLRNTTGNLSKTYRAIGNHAEASRFAKLQSIVIESAHDELSEVKYDELRIQYDVTKKESMLKDLQAESDELKRIAELETWQKYILGFGFLVLVIVAIHIHVARKKISAVNIAIENEKNRVSEQNAELEKLYSELYENERSLKEAQTAAKLANWHWNIREQRISYSDNLPVILGFQAHEVNGDFRKSVINRVHKDDLHAYKAYMFGDHLSMGKNSTTFRIFVGRNLRWIGTNFTVLSDNEDIPMKIVHSVQDVTVQKMEEENKIKLAEQRTFTRQLIESQETERKRIAGELHDGLGQEILLLKSKTQLGLLDAKVDYEGKTKLKEIGEMTDEIIQAIRVIAFDLSPVHLSRVGLTETILECISKVNEDSVISISSNISNIDRMFPQSEEVIIFRFIQEILNNIIKHSQAHNAEINITIRNKWLLIKVWDDGVGFDVKQKRKSGKGFGLGSIYNRVSILKGGLKINSSVNNGTEIKIKIPVNRVGKANKSYHS